jgi:hypothetical protein
MTFSLARDRRSRLDRWEAIARALGMVASPLIGAAAVTVLEADPSLDAAAVPPGHGVPSSTRPCILGEYCASATD